jgi:phosphate transport system substrate-binding protein
MSIVSYSKTVLMLNPLRFQAEIWRAALSSQQISVIWASIETSLDQVTGYLKEAGTARPDLLLIDLEMPNLHAYDLCQWCRTYCPDVKIVLTDGAKEEISEAERRWALHQGAEDLLPGFHFDNLDTGVIAGVGHVLDNLGSNLLQEETLIPALLLLCQAPLASQDDFDPEPLTAQDGVPYALQDGKQIRGSLPPSASAENALMRNFSQIPSLVLIATAAFLGGGLFWVLSTVLGNRQNPTASATFRDVAAVPSGLFNYGGSTTWAPIRKKVNPQLQSVYPQLQLRYVDPVGSPPNSGAGIRLLLDGQLDFAQSSRPLKDKEYATAKQRGFTVKQYPVGIDGIAVAVNPTLPVRHLTIEQLRQIYLGKITNWKQIGGPDLLITPFSRHPQNSALAEFLQESVLQKKPFASSVKYVYTITDGLRQLSKTPGGIYYASTSTVVPQCRVKALPLAGQANQFVPPYREPLVSPQNCPQQRNQVNITAFRSGSYPLTKKLFVIVKQDQGRAQQVGEAFVRLMLTTQGQQAIEQAGFVPIQ